MKRLLSFLACALLCFAVGSAHGGSPSGSSPVADILLEQMKAKDRTISLGFMLLSTEAHDNRKLEAYVRSTLDERDPAWVTAIKLYTISQYTFSDEDAAHFIASIPQDKAGFDSLICFESSITRHPGSKILAYLLEIARNAAKPELQTLAVDKLDRIQPLADGWVGDFIRPAY